MLSTHFHELFRKETYAVNLALYDNAELDNPFDSLLSSKAISGIWDKEYSMVPIGELSGRHEANPIPEANMTMGYACFGAISIEASSKVSLSKELKGRARQFVSGEGVDEARFSGYLADTISRQYLSRWALKKHRLASQIFNFGGIPAGHVFFNQRIRGNGLADLPNSDLIYDVRPLFAQPALAHPSYAAAAVVGPESQPVGTCIDMGATIADTGGYFNAFLLPPSYWALKRVWTHFVFNMQFDENDVRFQQYPNTLLVSSFNFMRWKEILAAQLIEPTTHGDTTNRPNVFLMDGFSMQLVHSPLLVANTWFVGRAKSGGVLTLNPSEIDDPWAFYRDEDNRAYFISFEKEWGFMVRNWRDWCAGAISTDGVTPPAFNGVAEIDWDTIPAGV